MSDGPKLCRDCVSAGLIREPDGSVIIHRTKSLCMHDEAITDPTEDLVTGGPRTRAFAYRMRGKGATCGPDAKLFSPVEQKAG